MAQKPTNMTIQKLQECEIITTVFTIPTTLTMKRQNKPQEYRNIEEYKAMKGYTLKKRSHE